VLDLRHADGWVGYGARIRAARFHALAPPGDPRRLTCLPLQLRRGDKTVLARYEFKFYQNDTLIYEGDQTALWTRVAVEQPIRSPAVGDPSRAND
jgi:hypothetical protein